MGYWAFFFLIFSHALAQTSVTGPASQCSFNQGKCNHPHGFVQDYGYGGFTSTAWESFKNAVIPGHALFNLFTGGPPNPECTWNPMHGVQTTGGQVWNGRCGVSATEDETMAAHCAGVNGLGYYQPAIQNILGTTEGMDNLQEELVFMNAIQDVHDFTNCQNRLFQDYLSPGSVVREEMLQNAFTQFNDIKTHLQPLLDHEYDLRARNARAQAFQSCIKEVCPAGSPEIFASLRDNLPAQIAPLREQINLLIARIPMANRDSMRTAMENLLTSGPVTQEEFNRVYDAEMGRMNESVQASLGTINSIHVQSPGSDDHWYCVDRELKENLQRSGQIEATIHGMGVQDAMSGFMCRSNNRYGMAGMVVSELALVPTYFVGYGFARIGLKMGLSTIRAVASAGRTISTVTRAAMLGLEAADWSAAVAGAARDCHSQTFFSRVEGRTCDPASEVGQVYEEASYAQCVSSIFLPAASALVGTTVRLAESRRLTEAMQTGPTIVVTGSRRRSGESLSLERKGITEDNLRSFYNPQNPIDLSDGERVYLFERYADIQLNRADRRELIRLHDIGGGYGTYSLDEIRQKTEGIHAILARNGVTDPATVREISRVTLDQGVLGRPPAWPPQRLTPAEPPARGVPAASEPTVHARAYNDTDYLLATSNRLRHEITTDVPDLSRAREMAMRLPAFEDLGFGLPSRNWTPYRGDMESSSLFGKVVGWETTTPAGHAVVRIDWDEVNGAHYNILIERAGDRRRVKLAIRFGCDGEPCTNDYINRYVRRLQR